jgi:hypothetical protein
LQVTQAPFAQGLHAHDAGHNLAHILDAWPTLPAPIRRAMLALIGHSG